MSPVTCQVCSIGESKYKCPACKTATCCLDCSKKHQAGCLLKNSVNPQSQDEMEDASKQQSSSGVNPFVQTSDIEALFEQYPSLKGQLRNIYNATQGPNKSGAIVSDRSRSLSSYRSWKPEHGTRAGLQALNDALQANVNEPSGMHAFMNLLAKIPS